MGKSRVRLFFTGESDEPLVKPDSINLAELDRQAKYEVEIPEQGWLRYHFSKIICCLVLSLITIVLVVILTKEGTGNLQDCSILDERIITKISCLALISELNILSCPENFFLD